MALQTTYKDWGIMNPPRKKRAQDYIGGIGNPSITPYEGSGIPIGPSPIIPGRPNPNTGQTEAPPGYFTINTVMPGVPRLPGWTPQWDENVTNFLSLLGEKATELLNRPKGLTPEEEALLRARMAEASKASLASAQKSANQQLYNLGLYGSPASAKVAERLATQYMAQDLARLRDLQIQEQQEAWQRQVQAQQLGQQYASLMQNWENIKNRYGLASAEYMRQNLLQQWKMAAEAAMAKRQDILMQEQINAQRRNEMFKWLMGLSGLYGRDYSGAMQGWGQQWQNYWAGQELQQKQSSSLWGGLGNIAGLLIGKGLGLL